ncbi:MAG TPA: PDZ domain-containing protein [Candidatus Kapabacteria bacterium]|nr:PDZ domain-containing protein [Candidatus Kapabacteria bacterium]
MAYSIEQRDSQLLNTKAGIRYHFYFTHAAQHIIDIEMEIDPVKSQGDSITLVLPSWAPGSYKIRDFISNVGRFSATDSRGNVLKHEWLAKNRIRVYSAGKGVKASYTYYGHERTVQHTHVNRWHAFINLFTCCMYVDGRTNETHHAIFHHADVTGWKKVSTALSPVKKDGKTFGALNYDIFADSPVEIGNHFTASFKKFGAMHDVAISGVGDFDTDWIVKQIHPIVEHGKKMFGELPYDRYVFQIQLYPKLYGGLEHARSHVSLYDVERFPDKSAVGRFLSLLTHEYFHLWNVKRIRPVELGPFDYTTERYTSMLYLAEGATSYYDDLTTYRCGFFDEKKYLEVMSEQHVQALAEVPGRLMTSIKESSFLTWVKLYLPSADLNNRYVSYYLKGGVLFWLLDMHIILQTGGKKRLDDGMRGLMKRYKKDPANGITEEEMISIFSHSCGVDLRTTLRNWLNGASELPTEKILAGFGLAWEKAKPKKEDNVFGEKLPFQSQSVEWFTGLGLKEDTSGLKVARVMTGSPAEVARFGAEDEILAVNGVRVSSVRQWDVLAKSPRLGKSVKILAAAEGNIYETTLTVKPPIKMQIVKKKQTPAQKRLYDIWLKR